MSSDTKTDSSSQVYSPQLEEKSPRSKLEEAGSEEEFQRAVGPVGYQMWKREREAEAEMVKIAAQVEEAQQQEER